MHLIKTRDNEILNLETGDLYHLEKNLLPENCRVDKNDKLTVSGGADCLRLWAYLESLLKFDATKAQAAPQDSERTFRYKVGDEVRVNLTDDENYNEVGKVTHVDTGDLSIYPYEVRFTFIESGDEWDELGWYRESDLDPFAPREYGKVLVQLKD